MKTTIGWQAFKECTTVVTADLSAATSVTAIGGEAFMDMTSLTTVGFSTMTALTKIESNAFKGCIKLTKVDFTGANALTTIEANAFDGCEVLQTLILTEHITGLGANSFANTPYLHARVVYFPTSEGGAVRGGIVWNGAAGLCTERVFHARTSIRAARVAFTETPPLTPHAAAGRRTS